MNKVPNTIIHFYISQLTELESFLSKQDDISYSRYLLINDILLAIKYLKNFHSREDSMNNFSHLVCLFTLRSEMDFFLIEEILRRSNSKIAKEKVLKDLINKGRLDNNDINLFKDVYRNYYLDSFYYLNNLINMNDFRYFLTTPLDDILSIINNFYKYDFHELIKYTKNKKQREYVVSTGKIYTEDKKIEKYIKGGVIVKKSIPLIFKYILVNSNYSYNARYSMLHQMYRAINDLEKDDLLLEYFTLFGLDNEFKLILDNKDIYYKELCDIKEVMFPLEENIDLFDIEEISSYVIDIVKNIGMKKSLQYNL